jgi:hypothetical protein
MGDYMPEPVNISEVVTSFYSDLKAVAADLNSVSDELGKSVSEIDNILKNFNLGIEVWVGVHGGGGDPSIGDFSYWSEEIGYSRYKSRWGICLRRVQGDQARDEEDVERWHFNDAPRALRLDAIDCLVELLQKLIEEGKTTTEKIRKKLADAEAVAVAFNKAAYAPNRGRITPPPQFGEVK